MAIDDLIIKLAKMFPNAKLQTVFLINNYDMTISVLKVKFYAYLQYYYQLVAFSGFVEDVHGFSLSEI